MVYKRIDEMSFCVVIVCDTENNKCWRRGSGRCSAVEFNHKQNASVRINQTKNINIIVLNSYFLHELKIRRNPKITNI